MKTGRRSLTREAELMEPPLETLSQEEHDRQLELALAVLRAVEGVTSVSAYPRDGYDPTDFQKNGVRFKVRIDGKNKLVNTPTAQDKPSKLDAARHAISKLADLVGKQVVELATVQVGMGAATTPPPSPELTEAEMQWLAEWYDMQPEPDLVTLEQAHAALAAHRASTGGTSATQKLFEAQLLQAKLRAATMRMEKAAAEVARWQAAIDEQQAEKRQRTVEPATGNYWDGWSEKEWKRQEKMISDRRAVKLSADVLARLPSEMPRGQQDGPLDHERLGLIGSLQYWAEGSEADAAKLLASLIKRLELQVS